jgi:hypothetical protein
MTSLASWTMAMMSGVVVTFRVVGALFMAVVVVPCVAVTVAFVAVVVP